MACGCSGRCSCLVQGIPGECTTTTVTGFGTPTAPYQIQVDVDPECSGGGGGGDIHDGEGARSTITVLSTNSPTALGGDAVGIGSFAIADGQESVALGTAAESLGAQSIAIGVGTVVSGADTVGIGTQNNDVTGNSSVGIGVGTQLSTNESVAILGQISAANGAISIGSGSSAFTNAAVHYAIAIGYNSYAENGGVSLGYNTETWAESVCIGYHARAEDGIRNTVVGAEAGTSFPGVDTATALGYNAQAAFDNSVALGDSVTTTATSQVNIGTKRLVQGGPATAPADADLVNSQISFWYDEAGSTLNFKVKSSTGVVKNGSVVVA